LNQRRITTRPPTPEGLAAEDGPAEQGNTSGALHRAVTVLTFMAEHGSDASIRELAVAVGLPRSTVHRVCQGLVQEGLLVVDDRTKAYRWGPSLLRIARAAYQPSQVRGIAHPILEWIVDQCNETALLVLYDRAQRKAVFVDRVETSSPVRYHTVMYTPFSPYAGASGKVVMAYLPPEEVRAIIAQGLEPLTPQTITDVDVLLADLARIRQAGAEISRGERRAEAVGIGAPIFDADANVLGTLMVTVPAYRSKRATEESILQLVQRGGATVSRLLGLPGDIPYPPPEGSSTLNG
jgi:DNA-binding IclR family transcriptional regulator